MGSGLSVDQKLHGVLIDEKSIEEKFSSRKLGDCNMISSTCNYTEKKQTNLHPPDIFMDSAYYKNWLSRNEADDLFKNLELLGTREIGDSTKTKYPLLSNYYGFKRDKDGAVALDKWGSYHESWLRVLEPTPEIARICEKLRFAFKLSSHAVNSVVVNYYFDGDSSYIPAHRDTVACLQEGSSIFCLSLGATRSFLLTDNADVGKFNEDEMNVQRKWKVQHGDLFALGIETNESFCHAVPHDKSIGGMRISIIFRSISKAFIQLSPSLVPEKAVEYASGKVRRFRAEIIDTESYDDVGIKVHICDLIQSREIQKLARKIVHEGILKTKCDMSQFTLSAIESTSTNLSRYYMGEGIAVSGNL